ncbi:MAG: hypothetical protein COB30_009435 [Ectothiorhodospiraceae bacterium]|nr:hypothetical protein [Ectothiorhodospiraceae bacterium]
MRKWGMLPDEVRNKLRTTEWDHAQHLKKRLLGERPFPITINLRPPSGRQALDDLAGFHAFIDAWQAWPKQSQLTWQQIQYAQLGAKRVPSQLALGAIQALIEFIGGDAEKRSQQWQQRISPILDVSQKLYPVLIKQLKKLESLSLDEAQMITQLLPQLSQGMGRGGYLRALPIIGVDTKFIEIHQSFITPLLDILQDGAISEHGGLMAWLDCIEAPGDWLLVRPLCPATTQAMGGVSILRMPTETLLSTPLPGERLIIVENDQSGYALPALPNTVAVIGGGRNLAWMAAHWLCQKRIGYWGDMDSWGFLFLSKARQYQSHVESLLMDRETLLSHRQRMVEEPDSYPGLPECLTEAERMVFQEIRDGAHGNTRLEQERLSADHILNRLLSWSGNFS